MKSLSSKSFTLESSQQDAHPVSMIGEEGSEKDSVLTLRDESFPLVYTWDHFLRVLENTTRIWHRQDFPELTGQIVEFYTFKVEYWPRFSQTLTKEVSVSLVFAEIMGVIKGSASSAETLAPLRRKEYLTRSCRMAPTFAMEAERSRVYDLFESYEALKVRKGDMDYVDRVVRLLRAVRQDPSLTKQLRSTFEEVYIDEIQDQRCLDIELLLSIVKDPRGFHFAGDTAQAISQDSTIRFSDIKGMFFQHFAAVSTSTRQSDLARPELFTLSKNYRSHQGILSLASFVMRMIWQGFPETVDKLEPEIGNLSGPKPVLFIGVDFSILSSSSVGHTTLSAGTADFGAEQAILVRDTKMKTALQNHIGDVALIFTILESKGMEFNDVITWNLLTDCPDQAGLRSLETLKNEPAKFDPIKHAGMCPELKNLYVAVTRARNQLFMVEGSETTAASVLKLLAHASSKPLVEVTRPGQEDFAMRLDSLRPDSSVDPVGWRRRGDECMRKQMYKRALMCFRKAGNEHGEAVAQGYISEKDATSYDPDTDPEEFTRHLGVAVEHFLKAGFIEEAARILIKMKKLEDAAELWAQHDDHGKAARLYAKATLYMKAFDSHHSAREYTEAAAMLRKERKYDLLVSYLDDNHGNIPANTFRGHSVLCKLLLKQNRISPEYRKHAINVLGSLVEQEACFIEYGMDEQLANLYISQQRHRDLFHHYSRKGKLERALNLAITEDLLQSTADGLEPGVLRLIDYLWVGHLEKYSQQHSAASLKLPSGFLTPNVVLRAEQWETSNLVYNVEASVAHQHVASIESTVPKQVLCLRKILDATAFTRIANLDDLPFEMMQEAIKFARDLTLDNNSDALKTVLLLTGLWKPRNGQEGPITLPWSPLRETLTLVSNDDPTEVAKQWVLDRLVSAILALDAKARHLWKKKWPKGCVQFMTVGFCPKTRKGEKCDWPHRTVSAGDCSGMLDDLLQINSIFCDSAVLYYRRSMNGIFREKYMGIKRHWLERLLRELTHLSSVEQNTSAIMRTQAELFCDKRFIAVSSFLEELLYFRLGNEWKQRSDFTSLLEQMQLAKAFGPSVQNRLFRALSHRLLIDQRDLLQRHLVLCNSLKENIGRWNASMFQNNLMTFLGNLDNIEVPALSTLHSLTSVFEYLATYLILKTCVTACAIPNSWIDLHVASIGKTFHTLEPLQEDDKHRYQQCLIQSTKSFGLILSRLNQAAPSKDFLLCSGNTHQSLLLRQRNAELVAIAVANLATTSRERPNGFNDVWAGAKKVRSSETNFWSRQVLTLANQVFEFDFIKAFHLRSRNPDDLTQKLVPSFAKYNGKDALVVVTKDRKKISVFTNLEHQLGVRTVPFDQVCPRTPPPAATHGSANTPPSACTDNPQEEYTSAEMEAIIKTQRLWRSCSRKIKNRRSYMQLPEARAIAHFIFLSAGLPGTLTFIDGVAFRHVLISRGMAMSLRLAIAHDTLSKLRQDAMTCIEKMEINTGLFESVDDVLHHSSRVEILLRKADEKMSDECIAGVVKLGALSVLEKGMKDIEEIVAEAERDMLGTRDMVDKVS